MEPGDVLAARGRFDAKLNDRVEIERRRVDDPRAFRAVVEQRPRYQGAGIEAHG